LNENVLVCQIYPTQYDGSPSYCLYSDVVCPVTIQSMLLKFIYRAQDGSSIGPRGFCSSSAIVECAGLATGWSHAYECAVDSTSSRILAKPEYYQTTTNTPLSCTTLCGSRGYSLAAGSSPAPWSGLNAHAWAVEYADECFCSDSYSGPVTAANTSECNMPCTGDATKTCGGGDRTQIYTNPSAPAAAAALPSGWSLSVPCAVDHPNRIFAGYDPQTVSNLTPAKCIEACNVCFFSP
jgi:hypothetical protein